MKKIFYLFAFLLLQSCIVNIKQDYNGYSRNLVFEKDKKWLINNIYSDLNSYERDEMNQKIFQKFNELSKGNSYSLEKARSENLIAGKISFSPEIEEIEQLKNATDFDYLVNIYTKKIRNNLALIEPSEQQLYASNEAFAIIEVYDIKKMKKIYLQKASSYQSRDENTKGPSFYYTAETLSKKNLKKIIKDIEKNAIIKN